MAAEERKGILLLILPVAMIGVMAALGVPLVLAGTLITGAAVIMIVTETLAKRNIVASETYWATLFTGWGILILMTGLILKGAIPLPLQITGDFLIDTIIIATITSTITITIAHFLPKLYSRITGRVAASAALPFHSPYLEK